MALGSTDGNIVVYGPSPSGMYSSAYITAGLMKMSRHKKITKKPVKQMAVVESKNLLFALSGNINIPRYYTQIIYSPY